mmetsp:Transcript_10598/g.28241  ORF Transcript_10598/g.28241 Transcript_10598/m.28241 type:complete len:220 (-) Transcript_10598:6-665(-)
MIRSFSVMTAICTSGEPVSCSDRRKRSTASRTRSRWRSAPSAFSSESADATSAGTATRSDATDSNRTMLFASVIVFGASALYAAASPVFSPAVPSFVGETSFSSASDTRFRPSSSEIIFFFFDLAFPRKGSAAPAWLPLPVHIARTAKAHSTLHALPCVTPLNPIAPLTPHDLPPPSQPLTSPLCSRSATFLTRTAAAHTPPLIPRLFTVSLLSLVQKL